MRQYVRGEWRREIPCPFHGSTYARVGIFSHQGGINIAVECCDEYCTRRGTARGRNRLFFAEMVLEALRPPAPPETKSRIDVCFGVFFYQFAAHRAVDWGLEHCATVEALRGGETVLFCAVNARTLSFSRTDVSFGIPLYHGSANRTVDWFGACFAAVKALREGKSSLSLRRRCGKRSSPLLLQICSDLGGTCVGT